MTLVDFMEVLVALAAIAGVFLYGLGGKSRQNTNEAIMDENQSLRNQLGDAKTMLQVAQMRVKKAEESEQYLKDLAQSKPDFNRLVETNNKLSIQLTTQHKEILESFKELTAGVTSLVEGSQRDRRNGDG
jgi:hypothetical protein